MIAPVISLAAYRAGVRVEGTTLCWRGMRHVLESDFVIKFAEALLVVDKLGGSRCAAGFTIAADPRCLTIHGWDMGPMTLVRGNEVKRLAIQLLAAERRERGGEGPVSA